MDVTVNAKPVLRVVKKEPALLSGMIQAVLGSALAFGVPFTDAQVGSVMSLTAMGLAVYTRTMVTPNASIPQQQAEPEPQPEPPAEEPVEVEPEETPETEEPEEPGMPQPFMPMPGMPPFQPPYPTQPPPYPVYPPPPSPYPPPEDYQG